MRTRVAAVTGLVLVGLAIGACSSSTTTAVTGTAPGSPASTPAGSGPAGTTPVAFATTTVDIDGAPVSVSCAGEGPTTVVFLSGLGEDEATTWVASGVPDEIARASRVCLYDRPGLGASANTAASRTVPAQAAQLDALVNAGALPAPVVLVGQGYGTFIARWYAKEHPKQVKGMVLVDPPLEFIPGNAPAGATQGQLAEYAGVQDLNDNLGAYGAGALPPPPAPTIVLGAGDEAPLPAAVPPGGPTTTSPPPQGPPPSMPPDARRELQRQLAKKSPFGTFAAIDASGGYIQYWKPDVVSTAIRTVLADAGAGRPPQTPVSPGLPR